MSSLMASPSTSSARSAAPSARHGSTRPAAATGTAPARTASSSGRTRQDAAPLLSCPLQASKYQASRKVVCRARAGAATGVRKHAPTVKIDNLHDPFATLLTVDLGDGETCQMLDTIVALKNLGLNIKRAKIQQSTNNSAQNSFYITESLTSEKIVKSARLEEIRMTVLFNLANMLVDANFQDSSWGFNYGKRSATGYDSDGAGPAPIRPVVPTMIDVSEAPNGSCSILKIRTADRPGLLVDIVRVLKDVNLNVVSAEVDTIGAEAQDEFFVTYRGEPLSTPMVTLVTNALQYYLSLAEVAKEESY